MRSLARRRRPRRRLRAEREAPCAAARDRRAPHRLAAGRDAELPARPLPVPDDPRARARRAVACRAPRDRRRRRQGRRGRGGAGRPRAPRPRRRGAALAAPGARLGASASRSRPAAMNEPTAETRVAIIGIGEAGAEIARDLVAAGCSVRAARPEPGARGAGGRARGEHGGCGARRRARPQPDDGRRGAGRGDRGCARLAPGAVYADLNTGSAELKRDVAATVEGAGALFADVAVMAPVPGRGLRTPLLASGSGAERLAELLRPLGAPRRVLGGEPGTAAARKLSARLHEGSRRGPARGRAAARAAGCEDWFRQDAAATLAGRRRASGRPALEGSRVHAARRVTSSTARPSCWRARRPAARDERGRGGAARSSPRERERRCARRLRARAQLLRGAFDTHVHIAPDVVARRIDDLTLARRFAELGLGGFQLKSHYTSTAERAAVVARGGSRRRGARGDRAQPRRRRDEPRRGRDRRARGRAHRLAPDGRLRQRERRGDALPAGGEGSRSGWSSSASCARRASSSSRWRSSTPTAPCCPRRGRCSARSRRHGLVLATGHLSRDEIFAVVDAALEEGVREIVITHPDFPSQSPFDRRPGRPGLARRPARALLHDAAHRQDRLGARLRGDPRHRARALGALDRSRPDGEPAGRGRPGADGRPAARGRLRRGGGARRWRS